MNLRVIFRKALQQLGLIERPVTVRGSVRLTKNGGRAVVRPHTAMRATRLDRMRARRLGDDFLHATPEERAIQDKSPVVQAIRTVAAAHRWVHPVAWEQEEWRKNLQAVVDALNLSQEELTDRLAWLGLHRIERDRDGMPLYTGAGAIMPVGGDDALRLALWRAAQPVMAKGIRGGGHPIDYKTELQGLPITIENRKGSIRRWRDEKTGQEGETKFAYPYGYIRMTQGVDGDHVDCFLGPNQDATHAYIIHQMTRPGFKTYDEDKAMLGFDSAEEAKAAYLRHYTDPRFFGSMHTLPMEEFTRKVLATKDHPAMIKALTASQRTDYERETEAIRERAQTPEAQHPHQFRAATWTHPNGHSRCRICGEEEREGVLCAGRAVFRKSRVLLRFGKASCSPGEKCRWITVHPHGSGEGQPVMIRESKTNPGTFHVIGGAGGRLNYLKLTDVKSPEHYKAQAKTKAKERREADKEQTKRDKDAGTYEPKKLALDALRTAKEKKEREMIEHVATLMGWEQYDLPHEKLSRYSEGAQRLAALRHHRHLLQQAQAVVTRTRERLLMDTEARAEAQLGELSIRRQEPDVLGLTDLEPEQAGQGLGFAPQYGRKAEQAGLTAEELEREAKDLQASYQASQSPEARESGQRLHEAMAAIRGEVQRAQAEGALATPDRLVKPATAAQAVKLLALAKELKSVRRETHEKGEQIKAGTLEPVYKSYVLQAEPVSSVEIFEELEKDADERANQDLARSFLREVETPEEGQTEEGRAAALHQHIQVGASTALTKACQALTGQDVLPRDVVDVLGTAGAAQALAWALQKNLRPAEIERAAEALATYHQQHHQEAADEALAQAREFMDQAKELELSTVESPTDLAVAHELNEKRLDALRRARSILGTTLGELEATAALELAVSHAPVTDIQVSLGPISRENAIRQMRALGLAKEDYAIDTDGSNQFATVHESGLPKLTKRIDPELAERTTVTQAILAGEHDEEGWLPAGFTSRPQSSYTDPNEHAVTFRQPFLITPGGTIEQDIQDYIGSRMADGEPVGVIYQSLLSQDVTGALPEDRRQAYFEAVDRLAPLRDIEGKVQRAEAHTEAFKQMAEEYAMKRYGGTAAPLHLQRIDPESPKSFEALHRTLAEDPRRMVAFKRTGDITHEDQRVLRDYFERVFSKPEADAKTKVALDELGPEPAKESEGLFGVQENPDWRAWQTTRHAIFSQATQEGLTWDKYVDLHRGREGAYAAMQDALKSDMVQSYADHYKKIAKVPLKLGRTVLRGNLAHLDAVDPSAREARMTEQRQLADRLRNRTEGKYAAGSIKDKLDRARELAAIADQNQMSLFQAKPDGPTEGSLAKDERWTLGETAENQLAAILPHVARNFSPFRPVTLMPDLRMDGKYIRQQRAVKLLEANKRMVMALGTGSGKTGISLGAFTHLHSQGKVKRGIYAVPSIVQEQFGAEAANMLQPGKYQWWAKPSAGREERLAAYRNPDHHFVVVTHQALRDDLVHLMSAGRGISDDEMASRFQEMSEAERRATLRYTLEQAGINWQFLNIDEGHDALNRKGKPNSLFANVLDALGQNTPYFMSSSADPMKNDVSEVFDQLHKVDPQRFSDRDAFLSKYGRNTNAAQDALKRLIMPYILPGRVDPGVKANQRDVPVAISDRQQKDYDAVMTAYRKAKLARSEGKVDMAALKTLSPSSFEGQPDDQHEAIARHLADNAGIIRDMALTRVLYTTAPEHNALTQETLKIAGQYRDQGRPGLIFAHSREAVAHLTKALRDQGHRVVTITGSDSAKQKAAKIQQFRPAGGKEAQADVMVVSDAGAVGMNAQRGKWVMNYDIPHTAKTWWQRIGRIHRLGQTEDVDALTLKTDTILDQKKAARLERKNGLREMLTSPYEGMEESGLGAVLTAMQANRSDHPTEENGPVGRVA